MAVSDVVVVNDNPSTVVVTETDNSYVVETLAGTRGEPGYAATVNVGTVTTGNPGTPVTVTNSGTNEAAVLDFTIPQGKAATVGVGSVTTGAAGTGATITNTGTSADAILNFTIPKGDKGDAATIAVGTVTTGAAGSAATVTNSGTSGAAVFNFTIPQGAKGNTGPAGPSNTLSVGTVSSVPNGTAPAVTITGTSPNQTINFTLEAGPQGIQGPKGDPGQGSVSSVNGDIGPNVVLTINGHTGTTINVTKSDVGLGNVDNTSDANKPVSTATQTALNAKADLINGLVPTNQLPPLAIQDTFTVASQAAMLALTAQRGDVAIRTDISKTYILSADDATVLANWKEFLATGQVTSVNGKTGTVSLAAADIANAVTTNTTQTISGAKTFSSATTINGNLTISGPGNMAIELGRNDGTASTAYIDFHSGATAIDFDSRIQATGGDGTNGNGTITFVAATANFTGTVGIPTLNLTNALAQSKTHASADTDSATTALHHTLGTGANQAAAGNHTHNSLVRVGTTANTSNTAVNYWFKVATITIPNQYNDESVDLSLIGAGGSNGDMTSATVRFRVKQQNPLGSAPQISIVLDDLNRLSAANFVAVTSQNDATATVVDLYVQNPVGYEALAIFQLGINTGGGASVVYSQGAAGVSALPAGTQTPAVLAVVNAHVHAGADITTGTIDIARLPVATSGTSSTTQLVRADDKRLLSNIIRLVYSGSAYPARPSGAVYVEWVGPVQPTGATSGDTWVNTA